MKRMNWKRTLAGVLLVTALAGVLAGCSGNKTPDPSEEVLQAQQAAADERKDWEKTIKAKDALADCGEFKAVDNLVKTYIEVDTENFAEMAAYESAGGDGAGPAYIFIGKLNEGVDNDRVNALTSQLATVGAGFEGTDEESMTASSGQFVIMAAGTNDDVICDKFTQVMAFTSAQTCSDVFSGLSQDLNKVKTDT